MNSRPQRRGIASGGNWIVDQVKILDALPGTGMLASILSIETSTGGAPANVLADLARLGTPFPLSGFGVVGKDPAGQGIVDKFSALGVDVSNIIQASSAATSFTDVMTDQKTGDRAFFHCRGANAIFNPGHVTVDRITSKIFHLGYILLLDSMDQPDPDFGTVAARLLAKLQAAGIKTSVDVVSEEGDRFTTLVPPALKHVDYLILNEVEAGRIVNAKVRDAQGRLVAPALKDAVRKLGTLCGKTLIAVHMPEGVLTRDADGTMACFGSRVLPTGFIKSAVGAGDAFCAGMLYGLHEEWDIARCVELGTATAVASLSEGGASEGVRALEQTVEFASQFPQREPPVVV